ncbi:hypothetical protein IEO21_09121 [Rhodonia placenta]|uniref:HNH nuclease domain-containing protein n=1 Tax=Rhodonia placenta TaxID=104341 RepID=A0A8H7NUV8_9APHY|nr:hypothetical protein IEO21_09121 [Postia placenta]
MNGLYILIPDTSHTLAAEHPSRDMSTPALSDDTGSSSSRESSRPATPTSGHTLSGEGTDIRIVEADADSSPPEDITRPLKRRRLADTRADEVRAERALPPDIWSDAIMVDDGVFFGLCHTPISDCTSVGDVEPDALHPSSEYVSRPVKRKRSADTSTYDVCAKRVRTSGTSNDATKAEDRACFGLGHMAIHDYTKIRVVEPDADPPVAPGIDIHVPLHAIARPPKRKRCADTTVDEVCVKRRRLSDSPSDASQLKDGIPFGPHPRCMITGFVSAEVEACYILPPATPQPLVYTYHVIAEDEQPPDSGTPQDHTIIPLATTADCSYRSLGWHELSANLHLMTIRVGREFIKRPLRYEHVFRMDALVHIPIVQLAQPDAAEPVSPHIERESPVDGIPRLPKRKRNPETDIDEVPAKKMRASVTGCNAPNVEDAVRFGPHPRCMITGCVSADVEGCYIWPLDMPQRLFDTLIAGMRGNYNTLRCHAPGNVIFLRRDLRELWETNRLLVIPHPVHLKSLKKYCTAYKYCVIAEDEHPPDSCATMGNPITPSVMAAPCSYRSLGWHKLRADLRLMVFRAGQKLSKRPFHYRHILRELLPHKEVNHTYAIFSLYATWTIPLHSEIVPGRRLWATGELAPFPDGYFRSPRQQYCPPLSDDDAFRFPRLFRPIVSGIKRKRSGDTRADIKVYTAQEDAQCETSGRWDYLRNLRTQSCLLIDKRKPAMCCLLRNDLGSRNGIHQITPSGRRGNYMRGPCETPNRVYQPPVLIFQVTIPSQHS